MKLEVSVVVPTHNPRRDYLERVLEALAEQTLDRSRWEMVVIDNKSEDIGYRISDIVRDSGVKGLRDGESGKVRVIREDKDGIVTGKQIGRAHV